MEYKSSVFRFRMITWVNINGFSWNLVCAWILWRSGLGLLMDKFRQTFMELFACKIMAGYYSLTFLLSDLDVEGMDVQIADQSGKPLQLPAAEKKVLCGFHYANILILNIWTNYSKRKTLIMVTLLTLVLLNPDMPCLCKQSQFRSVGF